MSKCQAMVGGEEEMTKLSLLVLQNKYKYQQKNKEKSLVVLFHSRRKFQSIFERVLGGILKWSWCLRRFRVYLTSWQQDLIRNFAFKSD